MDIVASVIGQKVFLQTSNYLFAPGSLSTVKFKFDLSDDWGGMLTFVQWRQGDSSYNTYLDANNCAYLPNEVQPGKCTIILCGTDSSGHIATTKPIDICIVEDKYISDSNSTLVTSAQYIEARDILNNSKILLSRSTSISEAKDYLGL